MLLTARKLMQKVSTQLKVLLTLKPLFWDFAAMQRSAAEVL